MNFSNVNNRLDQILGSRKLGQSRFEDSKKTSAQVLAVPLQTFEKLEQLFCDDQPMDLCLLDFTLGLLARYPEEDEIETFKFRLSSGGLNELLKSLMADAELKFNDQISKNTEIEFASSQCLYYDVSSTIDLPFMSGIQRVVRSLAIEAKSQNLNMQPFQQISKTEIIRVDSVMSLRLTDFENKVFDKSFSEHSAVGKSLYRNLRMIARAVKVGLRQFVFSLPNGKKIGRGIQNSLKPIRALIIMLRNLRNQKPLKLLYLKDTFILQPECALESRRVSWYLGFIPFSRSKLTMIVYDFIPVTFPETCASISGLFVNYMRLLRVAHKISCISHTVQTEVETVIPLIRKPGNPPAVATHWLGSSYTKPLEQKADKKVPIQDPLILVVGTLEPRKNHLMIARAAMKLHQEGVKFRLVFAGRVGWKQEETMKEYLWMINRGLPLTFASGITDAELNGLYEDCLFTMLCSLAEGFGLPIVESLQKRRPCIASNMGSMKEIADQLGGCVLVDPRSVDAISSAMKDLILRKPSIDDLGLNVRLLEELNWAQYSRQLYNFSL